MLEPNDLWHIERTKNIAANGRLFNVLMFALVVVVALQFDRAALWLAVFPILSIGVAYVSDVMRWRWFGLLSPTFATIPFFVAFYI